MADGGDLEEAEEQVTSNVGGTAFVLGGGGNLGAVQVSMLYALLEREILPEVIVGTSIGARQGASS